MKEILERLLLKKSMTRAEATQAMERLLDKPASPEHVVMFLTALKVKSESVDEIAGLADCLSARAIKVDIDRDDLMDVCGTGGDNSGTFNISTTVAFVLAAAGQAVAKHGNRSVSSRSGSFDLLEALGIPFHSDAAAVLSALNEFGIAFLFAPSFHPALKNLAAVRKSMGVSTVFNVIAPLLNPVAKVKRQVMGVYRSDLVPHLAQVLQARGAVEAFVVHGFDGVDEFSLSGPSRVAHLRDGKIQEITVRPSDFGLAEAPLSALKGGEAVENAKIFLQILKGEKSAYRDAVVLNTSAALVIGGKARDFKEGAQRAAEAIDSKKALNLAQKLGAKI